MVKQFFENANLSPEQQAIRSDIETIILAVHAIAIMQPENLQTLDDDLRAETQNVPTFPDAYPAIRQYLQSLGDNHSHLIDPEDWQKLTAPEPENEPELPSGRITDDGFAYIRITRFTPTQTISPSDYINRCHELIKQMDACNPKGWIIDLRDPLGGSCDPMIAGVGPLFEKINSPDNNLLGHFLTRKDVVAFGYKNGQMWRGMYQENPSDPSLEKAASPYHLITPEPPVAVLMGPGTMSAKEAVGVAALSLKPRVQIFGANSGGYANSNSVINYCDDTIQFDDQFKIQSDNQFRLYHNDTKIVLTTGSYLGADRLPLECPLDADGKAIPWTLKPDEYAEDAFAAATKWLHEQTQLTPKPIAASATATPAPLPP